MVMKESTVVVEDAGVQRHVTEDAISEKLIAGTFWMGIAFDFIEKTCAIISRSVRVAGTNTFLLQDAMVYKARRLSARHDQSIASWNVQHACQDKKAGDSRHIRVSHRILSQIVRYLGYRNAYIPCAWQRPCREKGCGKTLRPTQRWLKGGW